jgi:hypothetical protein
VTCSDQDNCMYDPFLPIFSYRFLPAFPGPQLK